MWSTGQAVVHTRKEGEISPFIQKSKRDISAGTRTAYIIKNMSRRFSKARNIKKFKLWDYLHQHY